MSSPETAAPDRQLQGRTVLMSGGSRGIGLAIAVAAARLGANVALLAKTAEPDPRLPGTIHTAAAEIEAAGGRALAVVGDVRDEESVLGAVRRTVEAFGGIDIVVNNASAISLDGTEALSTKKFDLMTQIEHRGTWLLTKHSIAHLRDSTNPHILSLSPPLNTSPHWLGAHPGYTLAKYGMSLLTLSWAAELAAAGIAANTLWPESLIATAAVQNLLGGDAAMTRARSPEIMADAAMLILTRPSREITGRSLIDVEVLSDAGVEDLTPYGGGADLEYDIFVDR